jgi:hypothetical protein
MAGLAASTTPDRARSETRAPKTRFRARLLAWLDGIRAPSQHRTMGSPRAWTFAAATCCILFACGERPEPPGAAEPNGGAGGPVVREDDQMLISPTRPPAEPEGDEPEGDGDDPVVADAGAEQPGEDAVVDAPGSVASGQALSACINQASGGDCLSINIAITNADETSCVQLSLDNCGGYARRGLPVTVPLDWRLGSASVAKFDEACLPGNYDPASSIIVDASGTIGWNLDTPRPSELVIDVTLEPASTSLDPSPLVISSALSEPLPDCE